MVKEIKLPRQLKSGEFYCHKCQTFVRLEDLEKHRVCK